ncbi:hypothetical protein E2320_001027 [Naja naja]|nr:hypothetical protein E2320_001027 [Naja naja]
METQEEKSRSPQTGGEKELQSSSKLTAEVQDLEKQLSRIKVLVPKGVCNPMAFVLQKFVSTTVRPTLLPYSELYNWDSAARFVSDYLNMEPLPSPLAPRDCPWPQVQVEEKKEKAKKYAIKPPRDLRSKYELRQEEKQQAKEQAAEEKKQKEEEEKKADLLFDLGDPVRWEFMLPSTDKPLLSLPEMEEEEDLGEDDVEDLMKEDESKSFDMPASWVEQIHVSPKEFEARCPQGKKLIQYKNAKLEKWAPYLNVNGLITRLTLYEDPDCK